MTPSLTEQDVVDCQKKWGKAICEISAAYLNGKDYVSVAREALTTLYGYTDLSKTLFKPTKATDIPFRPTFQGALSYFVGGEAVEGGCKEDAGFAINSGKGWSNVSFTNHQIDLGHSVAVAMGTYTFTCASTAQNVDVQYTFGYKRTDGGALRIFLHHSSVPYTTA